MPGLLPTPNFGPYISEAVTVENHTYQGEPYFTDLARSIVPLVGITPLTELFPEETIEERHVIIEQSFEGVDTIFPMVDMGQPDVVLSDNMGTVIRRVVQPLYIRRSGFMSYGEINSKIKPGTMNDKWQPAEQIQLKMERMVRQHNLTWNIYRAMMLLGGINYQDPRTRVGAAVSARIPAQNIWNYNTTSGYRGRAEHSIFRNIVDANVSDPAAASAGVPWTHPDAAIVEGVQRFNRWFSDTNKSRLTSMYMSPEMRDIILMSNQVRMGFGSIIPKIGASVGDTAPAATITPSFPGQGTYLPGELVLGVDGSLVSIAGVQVRTVDTIYKDPVDGIVKRIFPKNKIVFVSEEDSQGGREAPGRTQYCVSEESGGTPGLWTRVQTETQIPAAPGMYVQMGNAGMPYLRYPNRVAHVTVSTVEDVNKRMGVLGDLSYGSF